MLRAWSRWTMPFPFSLRNFVADLAGRRGMDGAMCGHAFVTARPLRRCQRRRPGGVAPRSDKQSWQKEGHGCMVCEQCPEQLSSRPLLAFRVVRREQGHAWADTAQPCRLVAS
eukprot:350164-Chlamydomonas_euryale.AAC.2